MDALFAAGKLLAAGHVLYGCGLLGGSLESSLGAIAVLVASGLYVAGFLGILRPVTFQLSETASAVSVAASIHRLLLIGEEHNMFAYLATGVCLLGVVCVIEPFMFSQSNTPFFRRPVMARVALEMMAAYVLGLVATDGTEYAVVTQSIGYLLCVTSTSAILMVGVAPEVTCYGLAVTRGVMVATVIAFSSLFVLNDSDRAPISDNYPLFSSIALGTMVCSLQLKLR